MIDIKIDGRTETIDFDNVKLPIVLSGLINIRGWDIPMIWAVDSSKQCFLEESAHGGYLLPCTEKKLISVLESQKYQDNADSIRVHFGMKLKMPSWAKAAKNHGWTPPASWNDNDYDF